MSIPTTKEIRRALDGISSTLGTERALNGTYSRAMDSIRAQHGSRVTLALRDLTWLLTAHRTLSLGGFRMAVSVGYRSRLLHGDADTGPFDEGDIPDEASILDVCRGLVIIEHGHYAHTIKFAHYSVHGYLERTGAIGGLAKRHLTVALGCLGFVELISLMDPEGTLYRSLSGRQRSDFSDEDIKLWGFLETWQYCEFMGYIRSNLHRHMQACHHIAHDHTDALLEFLQNTHLLNFLGKIQRSIEGNYYVHIDGMPRPLHEATAWGSIILVRQLLDDWTDISTHNSSDCTPLHIAVRGNLVDLVQFWLEKGAEVGARHIFGETPLLLAIKQNSISAARVLPSGDANLVKEMLSLDIYKMTNNKDRLKLLFEFGLSVEQKTEGRTMLQNAVCGRDNFTLVQFLLQNGARIDAHGPEGTALHIAARKGYVDILRLLLSYGTGRASTGNVPCSDVRAPHAREQADPINARDYDGRTILSYIFWDPNLVRMVLDAGAGIYILDDRGRSALHHGAHNNANANAISLLIEKGLTFEPRDKNHQTPLHYARGDPVALLLEWGADVNATDMDRNSPLHCRLGI